MIRYALKCADGHAFESWFASGEAFDGLLAAGHVTCPTCGISEVSKGLMAPKVRPARSAAKAPTQTQAPAVPAPTGAPIAAPSPELEAQIAQLKAKVEAESDYVGDSFANEARAMHLGDAPERSIYGEAKIDEAKELIDDGVPVMPLPFAPTRKVN